MSSGLVKDQQTVVNEMNEFFNNIGIQLSNTISTTIQSQSFDNNNTTTRLIDFTVFEPTNKQEILNIISKLDTACARGWDNVSPNMVHTNTDKISESLSDSINKSFIHNTFPDKLKIARITPIYKSGDKTDISNYRPISVLPIYSKIYERSMYTRLQSYVRINNILNCNQFGFLEQSNTLSATLNLTETIYTHLEAKKRTACIFIDLMKAFDCVDHKILIQKLEKYGILGNSLELLKNYLKNRKQYVYLNNKKSHLLTVKCGIPQGSILGPLLFSIYVNDIFDLPLNGKILLFADDAVIIYGETSLAELKDNMEHDLEILTSWLQKNKFRLNIKKTNFIIFQSTNRLPVFDEIKINDDIVKRVDNTRYLGLQIDSRLKWTSHVDVIKSKISPIIGVLRRVGKFLKKEVALNIYFSHILSHLLYAISIWGAACKTIINELQILQNKSLKALFSLRKYHPSKLLYNTTILPVTKLIKYDYLLTVYKLEHKMLKFNSHITINLEITGRITRNAFKFRIPKYSMQVTRNSIFYTGFDLYNKLPANIRELNINQFKKQIKEILYQEYVREYDSSHFTQIIS